jgi:ABC-type polysaccharide/polyol phosphate export permease
VPRGAIVFFLGSSVRNDLPACASAWLPVLLTTAPGLGLLLRVLNVFVRDVGQAMAIVLEAP